MLSQAASSSDDDKHRLLLSPSQQALSSCCDAAEDCVSCPIDMQPPLPSPILLGDTAASASQGSQDAFCADARCSIDQYASHGSSGGFFNSGFSCEDYTAMLSLQWLLRKPLL